MQLPKQQHGEGEDCMTEPKHRFTITVSPQIYQYLEDKGGPRGKGKYIEELVRRENYNLNNIGSVVNRIDLLAETARLLEQFLLVLMKETASVKDISQVEIQETQTKKD